MTTRTYTHPTWDALSQSEREQLETRYKEHAQAFFNVVSDSIDTAYYLSQYPDANKSGSSVAGHFLLSEASDCRNPTADFDCQYYLATNADVASAGVHPYVHYLWCGASEGRPPNSIMAAKAAKNGDQAAGFQNWRRLVGDHFDETFYSHKYKDIGASAIDPALHYYTTGWREGRWPNWRFDPSDYISRYPDIKAADVEPLLHFVSAGAAEGRIGFDPITWDVMQLKQKPIATILKGAPIEIGKTSQQSQNRFSSGRFLKNTDKSRPLVISISHDDPWDNFGGIQHCIRFEAIDLFDNGYNYIHISPIEVTLNISSEAAEEKFYRVRLNASRSEIVSWSELKRVIKQLAGAQSSFLVIHSLINHSWKTAVGIQAFTASKSILWIHDYSLLCTNFTLTRNELEYCGAPSTRSVSCYTCTFGETRTGRIANVRRLLNRLQPEIIAPSVYALNEFNRVHSPASLAPSRYVISHCELLQTDAAVDVEPTPASYQPERLRIAFLGHDSYHKGWIAWKKLLLLLGERSNNLSFYHLGLGSERLPFVEFVPVRVSPSTSPTLMRDAIADAMIDVAFIWPTWPETFSYILYEALAAGTMVATNEHSGNIAAKAQTDARIVVFKSLPALANSLTSLDATSIRSLAISRRRNRLISDIKLISGTRTVMTNMTSPFNAAEINCD